MQTMGYHYKMKRKKIFGISLLLFLLIIVIAPGFMFADILGHEFYHLMKHQDTAEEICIDINKKSFAHVKVLVDENNKESVFDVTSVDKEEIAANRFGKIASILYLAITLTVFNWLFYMMQDNK